MLTTEVPPWLLRGSQNLSESHLAQMVRAEAYDDGSSGVYHHVRTIYVQAYLQ